MTIDIDREGNVSWHFYRKSYKKARWRRAGQRQVNCILEEYSGHSSLIIF